jgi:regulatory subunit for Cdc7p protein kinase
MATLRRTHPPLRQSRSVSGSKRPRSPDQLLEVVPKRLKAAPGAVREKEVDKDKARRAAEREQQRVEFREKYSKAFPSWKFYFDLDNIRPENVSAVKLAQAKIRQLNGVCVSATFRSLLMPLSQTIENFFSNSITHLVTDQSVHPDPPPPASKDKENDAPRSKLRSPVKPRG